MTVRKDSVTLAAKARKSLLRGEGSREDHGQGEKLSGEKLRLGTDQPAREIELWRQIVTACL